MTDCAQGPLGGPKRSRKIRNGVYDAGCSSSSSSSGSRGDCIAADVHGHEDDKIKR